VVVGGSYPWLSTTVCIPVLNLPPQFAREHNMFIELAITDSTPIRSDPRVISCLCTGSFGSFMVCNSHPDKSTNLKINLRLFVTGVRWDLVTARWQGGAG
jgi:hypothetical protein